MKSASLLAPKSRLWHTDIAYISNELDIYTIRKRLRTPCDLRTNQTIAPMSHLGSEYDKSSLVSYAHDGSEKRWVTQVSTYLTDELRFHEVWTTLISERKNKWCRVSEDTYQLRRTVVNICSADAYIKPLYNDLCGGVRGKLRRLQMGLTTCGGRITNRSVHAGSGAFVAHGNSTQTAPHRP